MASGEYGTVSFGGWMGGRSNDEKPLEGVCLPGIIFVALHESDYRFSFSQMNVVASLDETTQRLKEEKTQRK